MKTKKAQMKIQQMAFMLMAVTLFFVMVGLFALAMKSASIKESASLLEDKNALLLVEKLANSPEFACGDVFDTDKTNCVDADKIMVLKDHLEVYLESAFWGGEVKNIEIRTIYPPFEGEIICSQGNYPDCNTFKILTGELVGNYHGNYISLCRKENYQGKVENRCELAKIFVSYEDIT